MALPAALTALSTIGGLISTGGQLAGMVRGNQRRPEKPAIPRVGDGGDGAMQRRQMINENKAKLEQLKQAAMQLPNVDAQTQQQYGPQILAALQVQGQNMRG